MLSEKMLKALNEQIQKELYSAYFYLGIASYFREKALEGFSSWMEAQAEEEMGHALRIYDYVFERGGRVTLEAIQKPPQDFDGPRDAFRAVYEHEKKVTASISDLVNLAMEEKDHATYQFLQWFVKEQVEEEASAKEVLDKIGLVEGSPHGIYLLDRELATRTPALRSLLIPKEE